MMIGIQFFMFINMIVGKFFQCTNLKIKMHQILRGVCTYCPQQLPRTFTNSKERQAIYSEV